MIYDERYFDLMTAERIEQEEREAYDDRIIEEGRREAEDIAAEEAASYRRDRKMKYKQTR